MAKEPAAPSAPKDQTQSPKPSTPRKTFARDREMLIIDRIMRILTPELPEAQARIMAYVNERIRGNQAKAALTPIATDSKPS